MEETNTIDNVTSKPKRDRDITQSMQVAQSWRLNEPAAPISPDAQRFSAATAITAPLSPEDNDISKWSIAAPLEPQIEETTQVFPTTQKTEQVKSQKEQQPSNISQVSKIRTEIWEPVSMIDTEKMSDLATQRSFERIQDKAREWTITWEDKDLIVDDTMAKLWLQPGDQNFIEVRERVESQISDKLQWVWFGTFSDLVQDVRTSWLRKWFLDRMSVDELAASLKSWLISQEDISYMRDSGKLAEAQSILSEREKASDRNASVNNEVKKDNPSVSKKSVESQIGISKDAPQEVREQVEWLKVNNNLRNISNQISKLDTEISEINQRKESLRSDIQKEFPTSVSKSALNAYYYDKVTSLNQELDAKLWERQAKAMEYERIREEEQTALKNQLTLQQRNIDALNANNGLALMNMSSQEIQSMADMWQLPQSVADVYKITSEWLTINTLKQMWQLTQDDVDSITASLNWGMTPEEIISSMVATGRFSARPEFSDRIAKDAEGNSYQFNTETWRFDIPVWLNTYTTSWMWLSKMGQWDYSWPLPMYDQKFLDYEGNDWADYPKPVWSDLSAPIGWVIESIGELSGWTGIRVRFKWDDWRTYTVDHLDPSSLDVFSPWQRVERGQPMWFVGNTGHVMTHDWIVITDKQWNVLRPDLLAAWRWSHASVNILDQNWNKLPLSQVDQILKGYSADPSKALELSPQYKNVKAFESVASKMSKDKFESSSNIFEQAFIDWDKDLMQIESYNTFLSADKNATKVQGSADAYQAWERFKFLLEEYKKKNGDTWLISWTKEQILQQLWKTSDPVLAAIGTELWIALANYLNLISWAAVTEQEFDRVQWFYPETTNEFELNMAKINWLQNSMINRVDNSFAARYGDDFMDYVYDWSLSNYLYDPVDEELSVNNVEANRQEILNRLQNNLPTL